MSRDRWRVPAGPDEATVALRFALAMADDGAGPALVAAAGMAAEAAQRGDIGVDLATVAGDVVIEALGVRVPVQACLESIPGDHPAIVRDLGSRIYLRRQHAQECRVAAALGRRLAAPLQASRPGVPTTGGLDADQAQAVRDALDAPLFVLGGGPGTGKTRTIASLCAGWRDRAPAQPVLLAAPTGKAAQRLRESLEAAGAGSAGLQAGTVHRLLKDADLLADAAAVIVDEASMLDLGLLDALLGVLPENVPLVLVGDPGQLASVEAGRVLGDLFDCLAALDPERRRHRLLERNFRAARALAPIAAAARAGDATGFGQAIADASGHVVFRACADVPALHEALLAEVRQGLAAGWRLNSGIAFLCAHRQGAFGVGGLNAFLREAWRDAGGPLIEPVLLEASLPDLDLWNGDLGAIVTEQGVRGFRRGGLFVPEPLLPRHVPGYALTVHKAQGSEFDRVVLVLPDRASAVMSRELLYTGITRARDHITILGPEVALDAALATPLVRSSGLRERLLSGLPRT